MNIDHNWVDWYLDERYSYIRVYDFKGKPHMLPFIVPNQLATLKIVCQMYEAFAPFRNSQKGSFFPMCLVVGEFEVNTTKGFEEAIKLFISFLLPLGLTTREFDPKGYYTSAKRTMTLGKVQHEFELREELMRNCVSYEEVQTRSMYFKIQKIESKKRLEDPSHEGLFPKEQDRVTRIKKVIQSALVFLADTPIPPLPSPRPSNFEVGGSIDILPSARMFLAPSSCVNLSQEGEDTSES